MRRRFFNTVSAVSVLLCLATTALWVRSYQRFDAVLLVNPDAHFSATTGYGLIVLQHCVGLNLVDAGIGTGYRCGPLTPRVRA